jgi:CyaY protein
MPLSDAEYHRITDLLLGGIESTVDRWLQDDVIDIDSLRTGGLLELTFPNRSKLVINTQPPLQEIWLAARSGGYHFKWDGQAWRDTKDHEEFYARLTACASAEAGKPMKFSR